VLEKGRIVEVGKHGELLAKPNGFYKKMWETQNQLAIKEGSIESKKKKDHN
jgi:ABC-type transport system involved in cytochrome bd biosynthesis fused ATPase/permease subunit